MRLAPSAVKRVALSHGLPLHQPASLRDPEQAAPIAQARPDVLVVAAYGLILPAPVLSIAPRGAINIHASLLPRWRGAAPIQRALLAGDRESGITIMQMDEGLDTGPMLAVHRIEVSAGDDAQTLHDKLAALGARLIVTALARLESGALPATPQPAVGATYAAKLSRDDGRLDWTRPPAELERRMRALAPWPGVWFETGGERIKVLAARLAPGSGTPGRIIGPGLTVACGSGALRLLRVQRANRAATDDEAFLRGNPLPPVL
jgi:methionyl-tRNA formyltransferase